MSIDSTVISKEIEAPDILQQFVAGERNVAVLNEVEQQLVNILEILDADPANVTNRKQDYIFALNLLGKYNLSKDREKAKAYYNRFLEINPENEALKTFVEKLNATEE